MKEVFTFSDLANYNRHKIELDLLESKLEERVAEIFIKVYDELLTPTQKLSGSQGWELSWLLDACQVTLGQKIEWRVDSIKVDFLRYGFSISSSVTTQGETSDLYYEFDDQEFLYNDEKLDSWIKSQLKEYKENQRKFKEDIERKEIEAKRKSDEEERKLYEKLKAKYEPMS